MTCTQLKDWLKSRIDVGEGISLGSIDGNKEHCIGVYPKNGSGPARVCIGGPEMTLTGELRADLLIHWGRSEPEAEDKAREVWGLFYGLTGCEMAGAWVYYADPGAQPVPLGRDVRGVYEFAVHLKLTTRKEAAAGQAEWPAPSHTVAGIGAANNKKE